MNSKIQHFVSVPGTKLQYPETVIYGAQEGLRVTVSAGVHCREYVGIQAVIELAGSIDPKDICGELHLVHAFNYDGLICRCSDVFPSDGKNLNRVFPGSSCGTDAERLAAFLEEAIIRRCDCIIDLHSGGGYEYLTPPCVFSRRCRAGGMREVAGACHARQCSLCRAFNGEKRLLQSRRNVRSSCRAH